MMLQIDDAGWGCLVGGVVIGCYRMPPEPAPGALQLGGEFVSGVIAPSYFQNDAAEEPNRYSRRRYLDEAAQVAATCLARLKATPAEEVAICSGHVLDGVRAWLSSQGYRWHTARITGALQEQAERAFQLHLAELGFNVGYDLLIDHDSAGLFWWRQIQWLKGGDVNALAPDPARAAVCKTGWAAYPTWACHPYHQARALAAQARRHNAQRRTR
jgi:hypothetical protein